MGLGGAVNFVQSIRRFMNLNLATYRLTANFTQSISHAVLHGKFHPRRDEILKFYEIYRSPAEILKFSERERIYGRTRNREKFRALFYAAFACPQRLP